MNWSNYICLVHLLMYFISRELSIETRKDCNCRWTQRLLYNSPHNRNNETMFDSGLLFQTGLPHNSWIKLCGCMCWSLSLLFKVSIPIVTHYFKSRQPTAQWGRLLTAEIAAVAWNNLMLSWLSVMRFFLFI